MTSTRRTTEICLPGLSSRQSAFVREYVKDRNAKQAAIRAGYSEKTAQTQGSIVLSYPKVQRAIREFLAPIISRTELTVERTLREVARLAYFDPRQLFNADGSPKEITELDDDTAACVSGIEVIEQYEGTGKDRVFTGYLKKYRIADKNAALDKAMKHLGLYEADNRQKADAIADLLGAIAGTSKGRVPADVIDVEEIQEHPLLGEEEEK